MEYGEPIRAERQSVPFFEGLQVDGYKMPNGDFCVGITGASKVVGYSKNWLSRILSSETGKSIKALRAIGFSEKIEKVVSGTLRGDRVAQSISLDEILTV